MGRCCPLYGFRFLVAFDPANRPVDNVTLRQCRGFRARLPLALGSAVIGTCFVVLVCWAFGPLWETNDDIGMSMIDGGMASQSLVPQR